MRRDNFLLGFSYYLDHSLSDADKEYITSMQQHHFSEIFTSLHIPEDNQELYATRLREFLDFTTAHDVSVFVDIDQKSLSNLPKDLNNFYLRLDDGFSNQEIAQLSKEKALALNASTLSESDIVELKQYQANFHNIQAWHNFYPRPETGLDVDWFIQKNNWFHELGITTQAFIPGNEELRGPIYQGLPTLEKQRHQDIVNSALELEHYGIDKIFIGDPRLSLAYQNKLSEYFHDGILNLTVKANDTLPNYLINTILHNRPDPAADVIRVLESRGMNALNKNIVEANNCIPRNKGCITIDNQNYGRYMGEVQLVKSDLPMDNKVNVLGMLDNASIQLLSYIGANQAFKINTKE